MMIWICATGFGAPCRLISKDGIYCKMDYMNCLYLICNVVCLRKPAYPLCSGCAMQINVITTHQDAYINSSRHFMHLWYVHCQFSTIWMTSIIFIGNYFAYKHNSPKVTLGVWHYNAVQWSARSSSATWPCQSHRSYPVHQSVGLSRKLISTR